MIGWQSLYIVLMFFGTFFSYLLPIVLIRRQEKKNSNTSLVANHSMTSRKTYRILSVCNCLSAGIFLGICFLNLIPYTQQEFTQIFSSAKIETTFPVGMFTVVLGLLLVLTLETIVMKFSSNTETPVLLLDEEDSTVSLHSCHRF